VSDIDYDADGNVATVWLGADATAIVDAIAQMAESVREDAAA
jgi:hypothetical protein